MTTTTQTAPINFEKGYALLIKEGLNPMPKPITNPTSLPIDKIVFATSVFQPRAINGNMADRAGHITVLAMAIRANPNHMLDPVLVWWSGKYWRVIDGHHRLDAYNQVRKDYKRPIAIDEVPVELFEGTLHEAMEEATRRNSKDKLTMSKLDKLERAWKFTALGTMSKPRIAKVTGISERTVATMRAMMDDWVTRNNRGKNFEGPLPDASANPLSITWEEAKRGRFAEQEGGAEEWATKQATEWATRFRKAFGNKLVNQPDIMAEAVAVYAARLPLALHEALKGFIPQDDLDDLEEDAEA